ncbi:MAG TPA: hypothetical protein VKT32_12610 [Chthonomonadaceae bacterium]|nr:hypothetical protein [Chthonomonadaceae bacterium]
MDTDTNVHTTRTTPVGMDPYAPVAPIVPTAPAVAWTGKVHWGAVWAGLLTAVPTFLVLQIFFYWVGALSVTMRHNALGLGTANEWLSPLLGIIAFFIGGWVATQNMPDTRPSAGVLNGFRTPKSPGSCLGTGATHCYPFTPMPTSRSARCSSAMTS